MKELEAKTHDAKTEMAVADALDEIRTRNARLQRAEGQGKSEANIQADGERERQDREDAEAARRAFERAHRLEEITIDVKDPDREQQQPIMEQRIVDKPVVLESKSAMPPPPSFARTVKKKKDFGAALGIKKKAPLV